LSWPIPWTAHGHSTAEKIHPQAVFPFHSGDGKTVHLKRLPGASDPQGLSLFRVDLLDYDAMAAAIAGC
jgi:hypothetical protein